MKLTHEEIMKYAQDYAQNGVVDTQFGSLRVESDGSHTMSMGDNAEMNNIVGMVEKTFASLKEKILSNSVTSLATTAKKKDEGFKYDAKTGQYSCEVLSTGNSSANVGNFIRRIEDDMRQEAFDGQKLRSAQAMTIATNLTFSRPTTFEMVLFPRIYLKDDATTLEFSKEIPVLFDNFARNGNVIEKNFRDNVLSIALAMWTKDLIKSNSIKILHILGPVGDTEVAKSREEYLLKDLKRTDMFKNTQVEVAPIAMKRKGMFINSLDVINLSSLNYQLNEIRTDRDSLNNQISVNAFYVKFTAGDQSIIHRFDVRNKIGNMFAPTAESGDKDLICANRMVVEVNFATMKAYNPTDHANTGDAKAFNTAVNSYNRTVELGLTPNFLIDFVGGTISVRGGEVTIETEDEGMLTAIKAEMIGFEIGATLANFNLRETGQLLGTAKVKFQYQIEYKDPVSTQGPISDLGKGDDTDFKSAIDLGTLVQAQSAVYAVQEFVAHARYLEDNVKTSNKINKVLKPVERSVSTSYLVPYYASIVHDVATTNSLTSTSMREDIKNNIMNRIIVEADKMFNLSKYNNAFTVAIGENKKPCIAIVTSSNIAKYLNVTDDMDGNFEPKKLTPNLDYVIVAVPSNNDDINKDFYETIYLTFVDPRSVGNGVAEEACPVSFGFTLYKTALTIDFQRSSTETVKYLTTMPAFRHIAHLPVMVKMNLQGIPDLMSKKVSIQIENKLFKDGEVTIS